MVAVSSFDELSALNPGQIRGKIVLYDAPYQGYGRTVMYRVAGPSRAASVGSCGGAGSLDHAIQSTESAYRHAGLFAAMLPKFPLPRISVEDAESIHRLILAGNTVSASLSKWPRTLNPTPIPPT